jgi:molybdate transport system ATP-binding protein
MLEVSIYKKFDGFTLDVEFTSKKKTLGILGASGCGKSMTLKCIAGIETPDRGRIVLNGRVLFDSAKRINLVPQKRNVGYLFQNYALFPTMTLAENIGVVIKEKDKKKKEEQIKQLVHQYALDGLEKNYPHELSGGQQQRAAIARMLASQPEVILLDEPFSALDSYLKDAMQRQLFGALSQYEKEVVMVTHNRDEVYRFCEDTMILDKGKNVNFAPTQEMFLSPKNTATAKLSGCKNISSVEWRDEQTLFLSDWGITLPVSGTISKDVRSIGIRAHDFVPCEADDAGAFPVVVTDEARLPFEHQYYLKPPGGADDEVLCWFVQRERQREFERDGLPKYLRIPQEKMMLLYD